MNLFDLSHTLLRKAEYLLHSLALSLSLSLSLSLMEIISSSLVLLLVLLIICKSFFSHNEKLPPIPPSIPILGHIHLLTNPKKPLHLACQTLSEKYGPILFLRLGFRPVLLVSSPSEAERCLTLNDRVFANRPNTIMGKYAGYSQTTIGWAPLGEHWRNLRRITTIQIFCNKSLQMSSCIREREIRLLFGKMFRSSEGKTQKVKFTSFSYELSYNIMTMIALGKRRAVEPEMFKPAPSICVLDFLPVLRWVGYKGIERKAKESQTKRDLFLQGLVDEFRRNQKGVSRDFSMDMDAMRKPIFELLLSLQEEEPDLYPDSIIKGVLLTLLTGGTDTTVRTIQQAMSLLLNHPEALKKVRDEIDSQVGNKRLVNNSDLAKLPYLRCVVNETLRLFPVSPILLPHFSSEDCVVGEYKIPKGTILLVNVWAIHRHPDIWEKPTEFVPERFFGIDGERVGFQFIPFGAGRRACPGAGLGLRMVGLTVGALIQCFDWEKVGLQSSHDEASCTPRSSMIGVLSQI